MTLPEALGIFGFIISVLLAALKVWETFLRKSRFDATIDWGLGEDSHVLEISIANVGWKKDSLRAIYFRTPFPDPDDQHERKWLEWEIAGPAWSLLPRVLDVDETTPRIHIPLNNFPDTALPEALESGVAQLVAINARDRHTFFPIPPAREGPPPPTAEQIRGS